MFRLQRATEGPAAADVRAPTCEAGRAPGSLAGVCSTGTAVAVRDRLTKGKEVAKTPHLALRCAAGRVFQHGGHLLVVVASRGGCRHC